MLGITSLIKDINVVDDAILGTNIYWMIGFAAILLPLAFIPAKLQIGRIKGLVLVGAYILFIALAFAA